MEHGGPESDAAGEARHERLGGARAEFVANLGRRVAELRALVRRIEAEAEAPRLAEELQRRLHSLGAGARLLRFVRVAERIAEGEAQLIAASGARLTSEAAAALRKMLEELPALAWGQSAVGERAAAPRAHAAASQPNARSVQGAQSVKGAQGAQNVEARQGAADAAGARAQGTTWIAGVGNGRALAPALAEPVVEDASSPPRGAEAPEAAAQEAPVVARIDAPLTALVVGAAPLADALDTGVASVGPSFEVERTEDLETAIDLARAFAPDVVLLDADLPGARGLAEALAADPLTELCAVVAIGRFARPEEAAPYVALGAARALAKPVSPDALRRAAAEAAATYVRREPAREPLGDVSLDALGARLAEELRRGLCDAAEPRSRGARVDLGDGAEVLAALWGAVARIRDLVTIRSQGGVRFSPSGPEGALPLAPWMAPPGAPPEERERARQHSEIRAKAPARGAGTSAAAPGSAELGKMDIVVADDDPAVTWFLAGVLRAAGATVHEAHDGARALDLACQTTPDLVVSDVLMPRLDGFALCRALKRDVALRDVPVILLSWKEDLLQRLRELGAQADGYLRKEASAAAFVQRVHEVLRGRKRVAERIAAGGEVRGRLDGMTTRTLLSLSCAHRPDALVSVRDAAFLYEVLLKEGRPAGATRTAPDGTFHRGPSVLAALLGVGSGRFAVAPAPESELEAPPRPGFEGTLAEQLVPAIAAARAAQRLLHGPPLMQVERVILDLEGMGGAADATPEPARSLLRALARGVSPRSVITSGEFASSLVEDVLNDVAARGGVRRVISRDGEDLLGPAVAYEEETLRGVRRAPERAAPAVALLPELAGGDAVASSRREPIEIAEDQVTVVPGSVAPVAVVSAPGSAGPISVMSAPISVVSAPGSAGPISVMSAPGSEAPMSLDGEDETNALAGAREVEARALASARIPREFAELQGDVLSAGATWTTPAEAAAMASVTPAVPGVAPAPRRPGAALPALEYPRPERLLTLGSLPPPPVVEEPAPAPASRKATDAPAARIAAPPPTAALEESPTPRRVRRPSAYVPTPQPPSRDSRLTMWVLFAVAAFIFAVGARLSRDHELQSAPPPAPAPSPPAAEPAAAALPGTGAAAPTGAAVAAAAAAPAAAAPARTAAGPVGETAESPVLPEDLPLPAGEKVPEGQGLLEVIAGAGDTLFVDGRKVGTGSAKLPLAPKDGAYEIRAKLRDEERVRFALVKPGRLTRLRVSPPWRR
ncbi:transcriptional regulator [Sorangium cellulosum]|uniref:Transcriptional regulator n=1 Tax=Sorangium cellulosum TaxID=56 RepID=A0A2L0F9N2_SORCE|nr:response regulator [Sorangium cellulosum]AUX48280.1 transcriptional regulator [Sorangium cellulosum]